MTLHVSNLSYAHPGSDRGIHLPDLQVAEGKTLAVIGPSGCGKTTFLNLLSALIRPDAGTIRIGATEVHALSERQGQSYRAGSVGYIFQDFGLLEYLNAEDNILHPYRICRGRKVNSAARARAQALAEDLGIADRLTHRPSELSHGERQRVAICRAFVTEPSILLADEPTGNLDPDTAQRIMDHLMASQRRLGATLVMVTHDHGLLERFDRVLDFRDCWKPIQ